MYKITKTAENLNAYVIRCDNEIAAENLFFATDEWLSVEANGIVASHHLGSCDVLIVCTQDVLNAFLVKMTNRTNEIANNVGDIR